MKSTSLSFRAALFAAAVSFLLLGSIIAPASQAQIRQTALYIDNGAGGFTVLTAPGAGGSLVLPSSGTLLTTTSGGTIGGGATWQGNLINPTYGGTGVNNGSNTLTWSGGNITLGSAAGSNVTLPPSGTLARSGGGATYQSGVQFPTGTTSTLAVMMGLAGSITPASSGKVLIIISGFISNTAAYYAYPLLVYGTGTAPSNGAAFTGFNTGGLPAYYAPFSISRVLTGLTVGTPYWIDLALESAGGGTASATYVSITAMEMP